MAFFRNNTVNLLNLHYGIHTLALSGGGAFFSAFLLRAGVSAPTVLAALALILVGRFAVRPFVLVPARRFGLKPLVIAGTVMAGLQYPVLAEVHGVGWELFALCAVAAVGDTVYWTSYHA
jgi:DHA1 family inner membrane transport protein